jgi:shikimate kinase
MERIFLIGPPGAGKTACGQALAHKLACPFFDTDQLIEHTEGRTITDIFTTDGESHFRSLERELLEKMLAGQSVFPDKPISGCPPDKAISGCPPDKPISGCPPDKPISGCPPDEERAVFATGGGLPVYNDNITRLLSLGKVVALTADLSVLVERVKNNTARPLLAHANRDADTELLQRISHLLTERTPVYAMAGYKIDTSGLSPEQVADEIISILYGV